MPTPLLMSRWSVSTNISVSKCYCFYLIWKYFDSKSGHLPKHPITVILVSRLPAYVAAQDIIHAILVLSSLIANDADVSPYLPGGNDRELQHCRWARYSSSRYLWAGTGFQGASGTSNMKFMPTAVTVCTVDGANIEIADLVTRRISRVWCFKSDEVVSLYEHKGHKQKSFIRNPRLNHSLIS